LGDCECVAEDGRLRSQNTAIHPEEGLLDLQDYGPIVEPNIRAYEGNAIGFFALFFVHEESL
jgi:hypothetical protein